MIYFFYNIFVILIGWLLIPFSWFNKKIMSFLSGRKETFHKLHTIKETDTVIWFHCASLGEFEQGRPIIEALRIQNSDYKIVLTFFSPSGYEIRKDYKFADVICYLPMDTKHNAKRFLDLINPEIGIFVKYEFWPNILKELQNRKIKTLLVSGIFRENQAFFKNGLASTFMKKSLQAFSHFFVQDENSKNLLQKIGFNNATVSGDTRFDRVLAITKQNNHLSFIADFVQDKHILVAGSSWKKDEALLVNYINNHATDSEKFIIAPHNIKNIEGLKNSISKKVILYSDKDTLNKDNIINAQVFIIDTIGILTKIYSYAHVAYIGGGFGVGIHNILEPATFEIPIIIGPNYQKFKEATDLVALNGCFVIHNNEALTAILNKFREDEDFRKKSSQITKEYIVNSIGATNCILSYIKKNNSTLQTQNHTN